MTENEPVEKDLADPYVIAVERALQEAKKATEKPAEEKPKEEEE
jgi:hypothetical protein